MLGSDFENENGDNNDPTATAETRRMLDGDFINSNLIESSTTANVATTSTTTTTTATALFGQHEVDDNDGSSCVEDEEGDELLGTFNI